MWNTIKYYAISSSGIKLPGAGQGDTTGNKAQVVVSIVLGVMGAVAVLILTLASLQYLMSQGDPQKVAKAKNTIIYAVAGLIITMSAYGIITFVLNQLA